MGQTTRAMRGRLLDRRSFLRLGTTVLVGAPVACRIGWPPLRGAGATRLEVASPSSPGRAAAKVAITACRSYGPEVRNALRQSFDLLGGVGSLVRQKTVTVKLNLTGMDFTPFLGRPVGETYMTHEATARALGALLFEAGARRVRFVESTPRRAALAETLLGAGWDVKALEGLGRVGFENTRNRGSGDRYATLRVPFGGHLFSSFELNRAYEETDVLISLAKLKQHLTTGVTLSLKNLFGITPNSRYGDEAGDENAIAGRNPLHSPRGYEHLKLPGQKDGIANLDPTWRVPRIVVDVCAARPIDLAIIDGITSLSGGEGPWCGQASVLKVTTPGVLIVGLNPVATDAVGTAIMGFDNPRAPRGTKPFQICDNHLNLAEEAGLGTADLNRIEVRGMPIAQARFADD